MKIGIPRALLYYWYGFLWENFWQLAGYEVLTSPVTTRQIMMAGVEVAVNELCLPVKIFLGHLRMLAPQVDRIMIPHLIKVESDAYICPKFMGLPDLVCHAIPALKEKLLIVKVGPDQVDMVESLLRASRRLGSKLEKHELSKQLDPNLLTSSPALAILKSLNVADKPLKPVTNLTIGLLGHPYCLYDSGLNLNLLQQLTHYQIKILTPEMITSDYKGRGSGKLNKKLFWTTGRSQFDALEWMLTKDNTEIDGFIHIAPFACGPEAIVSDMLERRVKEAKKPYLKLYFEEHSGEAGIITRLEAFVDLIRHQHIAC